MEILKDLHPVLQGLIATVFTYAVTALGAALVFFFKNINKTIIDLMLGLSAGVMIAASFWSLLSPAVELSERSGQNAAVVAAAGFSSGGLFVILSDVFLTKAKMFKESGGKAKRSALLAAAVTLHNIPEGLAVGVAFGSVAAGEGGAAFASAVMLAVGIGLQNFPEGVCVSMPLYLSGCSRAKSFMIGQASGIVEPIAGTLGALFAVTASEALPWALSFSGGAMIAVVCSELIPEAFSGNKRTAQAGILAGFVIMMVLDVALG